MQLLQKILAKLTTVSMILRICLMAMSLVTPTQSSILRFPISPIQPSPHSTPTPALAFPSTTPNTTQSLMSWPPTPYTFRVSPTLNFILREVHLLPRVDRIAVENAVIEIRDYILSEGPPNELVRNFNRQVQVGGRDPTGAKSRIWFIVTPDDGGISRREMCTILEQIWAITHSDGVAALSGGIERIETDELSEGWLDFEFLQFFKSSSTLVLRSPRSDRRDKRFVVTRTDRTTYSRGE